MFNLKKLAIAATADMIVRDAAGEAQFDDAGQPLSITLHSPGTRAYQKAKHAAEERNNNRVFSRMQGKSESKQSAEDKIAERAEFLASVTISFNNFTYEEKRGFEMFKAAYGDIEIGHIADDAEKYLGGPGKLLEGLAKGLGTYVRHAAWLNAVPDDSDKPKDGRAPSRLDLLKKAGVAIDMPPVSAGRYLIDYLYEFGPSMPAGMGSGPVTFAEMEAWERKAGIELAPWEARLLRRLSGDYLAESHRATKPNCPPPFEDSPALNEFNARDQARRLNNFFGG